MNPKTREAYVVWRNTDLTEGRGQQVPWAICDIKATANRVARGRYVMGADAPVRAVDLIMVGGQWFGPVHILEPTGDDTAEQLVIDRRLDVHLE